MLFIYKLDYMASVLPLDLICRKTHISAAESRILLLDILSENVEFPSKAYGDISRIAYSKDGWKSSLCVRRFP